MSDPNDWMDNAVFDERMREHEARGRAMSGGGGHILTDSERAALTGLIGGALDEQSAVVLRTLFDDASAYEGVRSVIRAALSASPQAGPGLDAAHKPGNVHFVNCPIEGVHEHAFRGPHRFREWEPGT